VDPEGRGGRGRGGVPREGEVVVGRPVQRRPEYLPVLLPKRDL